MGGGDKNLADQVQEGQGSEALMHAIYHPLSNLDPPAWVTSAIQYFSIRPSLKIAWLHYFPYFSLFPDLISASNGLCLESRVSTESCFALLMLKGMCSTPLNLSQPKKHFIFTFAASFSPAGRSPCTALPHHVIIQIGWGDPAARGILLQVAYGCLESPTCSDFNNCWLPHKRLPKC